MKKIFLIALVFCLSLNLLAGPGDTTTVQFFTFNSTRDSIVKFPSDTVSFEKVLMYYTLKCNPAQSPACGEWDYLTYTYLYEHTGVLDSVQQWHANFEVDGISPDSFMYSNSPTWKHKAGFEYFNQTTPTDTALIGSGNVFGTIPISNNGNDERLLFLWKKAELISAGLGSDSITGIRLKLNSVGGTFKNLTLRLKNTQSDSITYSNLLLDGFTTVYKRNTLFSNNGWVTIPFAFPFHWLDTLNLLLDFSYESYDGTSNYVFSLDTLNYICGAYSSDKDNFLSFKGPDYLNVPVDSISKIDSLITISCWVHGDPQIQPQSDALFFAKDANNKKVLNVHLPWGNGNIYWDAGNDGGSVDRIYKASGSTNVYKGEWNHWAFTKNAHTGSMKIYLNGVLWHSGTGKIRDMSGIVNFKIGSGNNKNYYDGFIDEFRVWNIELSQSDIQAWMYKNLNNSHPNHSNLISYYKFDEGSGITTADLSPSGIDANLLGLPEWKNFEGTNRVKNFTLMNQRPQLVFEVGNYNPANLDSVIVIDSVLNPQKMLVLFSDTIHPNIPTDTIYPWQVSYNYLFNSSGNVYDSTLAAYDSLIYKTMHSYFDPPFEIVNRFEIGRFITPYGIGLDLGNDGFTWIYDVSDYIQLLKDSVHIKAGNWQELLDLKFLMIQGTPEREVQKIETLWKGSFSLKNFENTVTAKTISPDTSAKMFRLKARATGHQFSNATNCAEFCPKIHSVKVNNSTIASWQIVQECADNAVYPQGGTWIYDRAGWCPGALGKTQNIEITDFVTIGDTFNIDYNSQYDLYGNYIFEGQLVSYGNPNFQNNASIEDVIAPNKFKYHLRYNPICGKPIIKIKNSGSNDLTSLAINYGPDGINQVFNWTGNLKFTESVEVTLDPIDWTNWTGKKTFLVSLSNPNGTTDEYSYNNSIAVDFETPPQYPNIFQFWLRTNNAGSETSYTLKDAAGNIMYSRSGLLSNSWYKDTFNLADGCYTFQIKDSGDDGIDFWANNDGIGSARFKYINGQTLRVFDGDFGKEYSCQFTVGFLLKKDEIENETNLNIFPNPAKDKINVSYVLKENQDVTIIIRDVTGHIIHKAERKNSLNEIVEFELYKYEQGIYFCTVVTNNKAITKKFVLMK